MGKKNELNTKEKDSDSKNGYEKLITKDLKNILPKNLPNEIKEKIIKNQDNINKFAISILEKYKNNVLGISISLPPKDAPEWIKQKGIDIKEKVFLIVLIDSKDAKPLEKIKIKDEIVKYVNELSERYKGEIIAHVMLLDELWQSCYDSNYSYLALIAMSFPVYDKGIVNAIKIVELHKTMVLRKFEHYVVSYVLAGSLVQGKAKATSDIDVWIVIDDTDVKRMGRFELLDKLRAIIITMGIEAGELTGIKNKLNIQVYLLTDFWENLKEANPVIFTLLRDGVPFYDRGLFMPWKRLLKSGRIKPSQESIDLFKSTGQQIIKRAESKLKEIAIEDLFWAIITPTQAALMLYGFSPPTPRETVELVDKILVKKEKLLDKRYANILEKIVKVRKDIEHGIKKTITGEEVDKLLKDVKDYLKNLDKLFDEINKKIERDKVLNLYNESIEVLRNVLISEGIKEAEKLKANSIIETFKKEIIDKRKLPYQYIKQIKQLIKDLEAFKKDLDSGKVSKQEIEKAKKIHQKLVRDLEDYIKYKKSKEIEKCKVLVRYDEKYGEVLLIGNKAYITLDISKRDKILEANVDKEGHFKDIKEISLDELDKAIAKLRQGTKTIFLNEILLKELNQIFGSEVEIMLR